MMTAILCMNKKLAINNTNNSHHWLAYNLIYYFYNYNIYLYKLYTTISIIIFTIQYQ